MKGLLAVISILFLLSTVFAQDVYVRGYYRKDGTYVRPHYRSKPDGVKYNNYGRASYRQRKEYEGYSVLPSYNNDYDDDGIANRYDYDDDNDGIFDDYDSSQYGRDRYIYTSPYSYDDYGIANRYDYGDYDTGYFHDDYDW